MVNGTSKGNRTLALNQRESKGKNQNKQIHKKSTSLLPVSLPSHPLSLDNLPAQETRAERKAG